MSRLIKIADWKGEKRGAVIFIHGLGGHPYDTWRRNRDSGSFWPLWLAQDIGGLAVYTLGYISPPSNWFGTAMPLVDESANILRLLINEPELREGHISFVCHSLGGLLIKQVLRSAKEQRSDPKVADFFDRTRQVVFIATPHTGSGKATLLQRLGFLFWGSDSAKDMVANRPELRDLNVGYRGLAEERRGNLNHLVFFEMADTALGRIVAPDSSDPGLPYCKPVPIREDHISISKPRSRRDLLYLETREFVAQLSKPQCGAIGEFEAFELEAFNVEWSWKYLVPKLARASFLLLLAFGVWAAIQELSAWRRSTQNAERRVEQLQNQVDLLSKKLVVGSAVSETPGAEKAVRLAIQTTAEGAAAGDQRFVAALNLLEQGRTVDAELLFRAVAEEKATQVKANGNAAAMAFRNLGAIAGLSDPRRAREDYRRALEFNPEDMESLYWYGWLNQLSGNLAVAEQTLKTLLAVASGAQNQVGIYRANLRLGEVIMARGSLNSAFEYQSRAMAIATRQVALDSTDSEWQWNLSISYEKIGDILEAQGHPLAALEHYNASLSIRDRLSKTDPGNADWLRDLSVSHNKIGRILQAQGNRLSALDEYNASLAIRERLAKAAPDNAARQRDLSVSYEKIGEILEAQGSHLAALENYRASVAIRERLARADPDSAGSQRDLSVSYEKLGDILEAQGSHSDALNSYNASFVIRDRIANADPGNSEAQRDLAVSLGKIGHVLRVQGDFDLALKSLNKSLSIRSRLAEVDPGNSIWQVDLALGHALIGQVFRAKGGKAEALRELSAARNILAPLAERSGNRDWARYVRTFDEEIAAVSE
jgi:tetratricopeptide (TPR) repeat protein